MANADGKASGKIRRVAYIDNFNNKLGIEFPEVFIMRHRPNGHRATDPELPSFS
jgi:hypothetical protein